MKHCQRHNRPRILSIKLELSQQLKRIQIPDLLAFLHSLVTTFCTSLSSYWTTTISMTPITSPIMMRKKTPAQTSHTTPAQPCRPPWSPHIPHWAIGHLHTSLLLHHHLKGRHQWKKNIFFRALPECRGGGLPMPEFFGPFFHHVFPYILTSISCYLILFGHF